MDNLNFPLAFQKDFLYNNIHWILSGVEMNSLHKRYILFFLISALVWAIVPMLRQSLPLDTQEALVWGKYCLWGTTKHPPLSGWIAWSFYSLVGKTDSLFYVLNPLCVLVGCFGIYKLAKCFLPPLSALMATAFQLGVVFYTFSAVEFNVNVLSLALWPWAAYFFWQAYQKDKLKNWVLFGVFMALNILNKYVGSVLGIALLAFVLFNKKAWRVFKNPRAYCAGIVCVLLLIPHLLWLYDTHFEMLKYIGTRNNVGKIKSVLRHVVYPVKFLMAQILFALPAGLTFWFFSRKIKKTTLPSNRERKLFLLCVGIIPTAFWMISSFLSGNALKDMWNFPSLFAWGIVAFYFFPKSWTSSVAKKYGCVMLGWSLIFAVGYVGQCLISPSERFQSDCPKIVANLETKWANRTGKHLEYVGGNIWFSDMMALYGTAKPMIWMNPESNPWFNADDFYQKGALVVAENMGEYKDFQARYKGKISDPEVVEMIYQSPLGKKKTKQLVWGIYEGGKNEE